MMHKAAKASALLVHSRQTSVISGVAQGWLTAHDRTSGSAVSGVHIFVIQEI